MKKKQFLSAIENAGIPAKLGMAVVRQLGYTSPCEEVAQNLSDIASHGINGGFCGFIYYTDTKAFFRKNKKAIVALAENMAENIGEGNALDLVCGFNCFKGGTAQERRELPGEVARALYGRPKAVDHWNVENALAWFAGEEVARAWTDWVYDNKND